jgi:hypothetical protein
MTMVDVIGVNVKLMGRFLVEKMRRGECSAILSFVSSCTHIFNHLPKAKHARQRMIFFFLIFSWSPSFFIHCTRKSKFMTNFRAWTRKLVLKCDFQLSSDYSFLFFCWIYDLSRWGWIDDLQRSTFVLNWVCWLTSDSDLQFDQQPARSPCREPVTFFLDGFTDLIQSVNTVRTQG